MALKALSVDKTKTYQSKLDPAKGSDEATTFVIKALSARQAAKIRDKSTKFSSDGKSQEALIMLEMNTANIEFVRYGLKDWRNFKNEDGELVTINLTKDGDGVECVSEKCLDMLPPDIMQELAQEITGFNNLTDDERKN